MSYEVLIGVCATIADWKENENTLWQSFDNIASSFDGDCLFYVVLQGSDFSFDINKPAHINIEFNKISFLGVSNARNMCIEKACEVNTRFIMFHDASVFWPRSAATFMYAHRNNDTPVRVNLVYKKIDNVLLSDENHHERAMASLFNRKVNPIYAHCVGAFLFKVKDLSTLRFDTRFGPGQNTRFKSGEDVIFLFDYFSKMKSYWSYEAKDVFIYHPPRGNDYSKHLTYAFGQGRMFKVLLHRHQMFSLYKDILLFFGNALFRCLILRENSLRIFMRRVRGFLSFD